MNPRELYSAYDNLYSISSAVLHSIIYNWKSIVIILVSFLFLGQLSVAGYIPFYASMLIAFLGSCYVLYSVYTDARVLLRKPLLGPEAMIGSVATAITDLDPEGLIQVSGERWRARCQDGAISKGTLVRIQRFSGLTALVRKEET